MTETTTPSPTIADIQSAKADTPVAIDKVGIKSIKHPILIPTRDGEPQATIATVDMYVNLASEQRGTHMSRFISLLEEQKEPLDLDAFSWLLQSMTNQLDAESGYINVNFPFFMRKSAPVSKTKSLLDYDVTLFGEWHEDRAKICLTVIVPVTSLCPCSKAISNYGAHNQRSHITVTAALKAPITIESLIETVEAQASCELYGLLKRGDEKYVTEKAYDNPKFVEDVVRDIAAILKKDARIDGFKVTSENFESIHNHSAYAEIIHKL